MSSGYFGTVLVAAMLSLSYIETDCNGLSMLWRMDDPESPLKGWVSQTLRILVNMNKPQTSSQKSSFWIHL